MLIYYSPLTFYLGQSVVSTVVSTALLSGRHGIPATPPTTTGDLMTQQRHSSHLGTFDADMAIHQRTPAHIPDTRID